MCRLDPGVEEVRQFEENEIIMTDGTEYSGIEIGDLNEETSETSGEL